MTVDTHSVLLVTKDQKLSSLISVMLQPPLFEVCIVSNFIEARRKCAEQTFNIVLADFADGEGVDFCTDISDSLSTVMIFCPNELYEQISYKVESFGIITIPSPFDQMYFYNMMKVAIAIQYKVTVLSSQTMKLKEKMEEIRIVNRAKMLLMQNLSMTEADAHRYLEKEAMDRGLKRIKVAQQVISTYAD